MPPITFTLDLEAGPTDDREPRRFRAVSGRVLGAMADRGIKGTVFVVGEVAESDPGLVRDVAGAGHELGLHSYRHVPLTEITEAALRDDVRRGKDLLEEITGRPVAGFRAPYFSLVAETPWVPDVLAEAGFVYSSSVLPASSPLFGFPGCPARPFRWPNGLVELPVPVMRLGPVTVPFLGGIYLRLLPLSIVRQFLRRVDGQALWTYCHPYDFDPGEPFRVLPDLGWAKSRLLWANRGRMLAKMTRLLGHDAGGPLEAAVAGGRIRIADHAPDASG